MEPKIEQIDLSLLTSAATTHFKGWAKPGPVPPGLASGVTIEPHETLDAISGHFRLFQLRDGHRFSTDDILTAWYGTTWCPTARTARASLAAALPVLHAGKNFDLITGSPPYFPPDAGVKSEHPQKLACRFELRGTIADYCTTAARHLASGGFFACVFPHEPAQLARMEAAAKNSNLVIVRKRPVVFREGDPALVALFGLMRADDLPEWFRDQTWTEPDLLIRMRDGKLHPEYSAVKLAIGFPP